MTLQSYGMSTEPVQNPCQGNEYKHTWKTAVGGWREAGIVGKKIGGEREREEKRREEKRREEKRREM